MDMNLFLQPNVALDGMVSNGTGKQIGIDISGIFTTLSKQVTNFWCFTKCFCIFFVKIMQPLSFYIKTKI